MSEPDDLTTDAIPSPPRDEVKSEKIEHENDIYVNTPKMKTKTKQSKKTKKTSLPTAHTSVINIVNGNGIHIGSNYTVYVNDRPESNPPPKDYVITEAIKALFNSTEPVKREHLILLSQHINAQWKSMARALGFSEGEIDQFHENFIRSGLKEVIIQLLLDWIQVNTDDATIGRLSKTLWDTNQRDAVTRWSKCVKT